MAEPKDRAMLIRSMGLVFDILKHVFERTIEIGEDLVVAYMQFLVKCL